MFEPLTIDTQSDFIFQVALEYKKFQKLKSCSSIASLQMQAGHEYRAVYEVSGIVLGCSLTIFDLSADQSVVQTEQDPPPEDTAELEVNTPAPIAYKAPELGCLKVGKTGYRNNVPVHTELQLRL